MKKYLFIVLIVASVMTNAQDQNFAGKQILIYTRNGDGYVHDNIAASVEALEEICKSMNVETSVTDDPTIFESAAFLQFDAVIFTNTNNEAFLNELQRVNFQKFIRSGKGFVGVHSACGSERDWPWFWSMLGGKFVRHPKLQEFDIKITNKDHPSTLHLPETWRWEDECYFMDQLNPAINVLISVDLTSLKDDGKREYPGTVFGDLFPLAWYHEFEGGKSWYTALGHKIGYYSDKNFRQHLSGGIQWVLE